MHVLSRLSITGLWGTTDISHTFSPSVNFIIGPNGSGKTAVIRLITAALSGDLTTLRSDQFSDLTLALGSNHANEELIIRVSKYEEPDGRDISAFELNGRNLLSSNADLRTYSSRAALSEEIKPQLAELIHLVMFTIHRDRLGGLRAKSASPLRADLPIIDRTLTALLVNLGRFFSECNSKAEEALQEFVGYAFANLLPARDSSLALARLGGFDRLNDQKAFDKILHNFGKSDPEVAARTSDFFEVVERTQERMEKYNSEHPVTLDDIFAVAYSNNIHRIVQKWEEISNVRDAIYFWQTEFITTLNSLFFQKSLSINERSELQIELTNSSRRLHPLKLSSGEKQLLLILGEALLQRQQSSIYIADEPELSLHIEWQEKLVDSILRINPAAQIIFATHSPDIVGKYRDHVLDMSKSFS